MESPRSTVNPSFALPPQPTSVNSSPPSEPSPTPKLSTIGAHFFSASLQVILPLAAVLVILSLTGFINHSHPLALSASLSKLKEPTKSKFSNSSAASSAPFTYAQFSPAPAPMKSLSSGCSPLKRCRRFGPIQQQQPTKTSPTEFCACIQQIGIIIPMIPIIYAAFSLFLVDLALYYGGKSVISS